MRRFLWIFLALIVCLCFTGTAFSQNKFYIGPVLGGKHSLSICRNFSVAPTRSTSIYDSQGGILFGYGNDRFSIESNILFGTLGAKYVYDSPLMISDRKFKIINRKNDHLSINLKGFFIWREIPNKGLSFGNSIGVSFNSQYSKSISSGVTNQSQSLQGDNGQYILTYDDLLLGSEETNFSILSGLFAKWKLSSQIDLRTELGLNLGIDPLNARILFANLEYIDPKGENSWKSIDRSETYLYSKGDHFFFNFSILFHIE